MPTKSLLINYNDCPSSLDSLIPDNGLANLAGSLIRAGHKTKVLDYSTIQTLIDFRPKKIRKKLKKAFMKYKLQIALFGKMTKGTYEAFRDIETDIQSCRTKKIQTIIEEIAGRIGSEKIDFISFKLWTGEGFLGSVKIASEIKKRFPDIKIFAGGPHVEVFGERIFSYTGAFDILCQGEGEEVIVLLAEYAQGERKLEDIPSIIYKRNDKIVSSPIKFIDDLNSLADPVYSEDIYLAMKGNQKIKLIMLEESRGCPYSCNFCIHKIISGNKWRLRSVDNVLNTIRKLSSQIKTRAFKFSGSNTPYFFRKQLAQQLIASNMNIDYVAFSDTRQPEDEDYELLKKSGCVSLFFGVESADDYLLEHVINKKTNAAYIKKSLKEARKAGILTAASIIVPCPGQRSDSVRKTIDLLVETKLNGVSVYIGVCYPKTRWFLESEKFGFELLPDVEDKMMTYTIKFTMPPALLAPAPFKMNGKDFFAMIDEVIKASGELEKKGIVATLNDSLLFMAHILKISPKKIKNLNQRSIILGESQILQKNIALFNSRVNR